MLTGLRDVVVVRAETSELDIAIQNEHEIRPELVAARSRFRSSPVPLLTS